MKEVKTAWYTLKEKQPENEIEVIIADINGEVTFAAYYVEDEIFMNEFDQAWEIEEVAFWMEKPKHPNEK